MDLEFDGQKFDHQTAAELSARQSWAAIQQQIDWLPLRHPSQNPLGMLRRAIEENWSMPARAIVAKQRADTKQRETQQQRQRQEQEDALNRQKRKLRQWRAALLVHWQGTPTQRRVVYQERAIERAADPSSRRRLQRSDPDDPETETLEELARELDFPLAVAS